MSYSSDHDDMEMEGLDGEYERKLNLAYEEPLPKNIKNIQFNLPDSHTKNLYFARDYYGGRNGRVRLAA